MDFIALDFETANQKMSSPCSIGIVIVKNDVIVDTIYTLINPEDKFSSKNTEVHGITALSVVDKETFPTIWKRVERWFRHYPVVSHNVAFEKSVIEKTTKRYKISIPDITYYCTYELSKLNYPNLEKYTLDYLCEHFGISLKNHHNALEDALACAELMIKLTQDEETILHAQFIGSHVDSYSDGSNETAHNYLHETPEYEKSHVTFDDVSHIEFEGKRFVITGDFEEYSRSELKAIISSKGGSVTGGVSKKTDYLIVGMLDKNVVGDAENVKSAKIIDAENHRLNGTGIKIIDGERFIKLLSEEK